MQKKNIFSIRRFISFSIFIFAILITFTGILMYIKPQGRGASWVNWNLIGLSKGKWEALHTISSFSFVILIAFHIIINLKSILSYLTKKSTKLKFNSELLIAVLLAIFILTGTYFEVVPFKNIIKLGDYLSDSWVPEGKESPVQRAESMEIYELCRFLNIDYETAINNLNDQNIIIRDEDISLKKLSKETGLTPRELFLLMVPK